METGHPTRSNVQKYRRVYLPAEVAQTHMQDRPGMPGHCFRQSAGNCVQTFRAWQAEIANSMSKAARGALWEESCAVRAWRAPESLTEFPTVGCKLCPRKSGVTD